MQRNVKEEGKLRSDMSGKTRVLVDAKVLLKEMEVKEEREQRDAAVGK